MNTIKTAITAGLFLLGSIQSWAQVTVYSNTKFGGKSHTYTVAGEFDLKQTIGDNVLSSIKVSPGWKVTVQEHGMGRTDRGRSMAFTSDISDLTTRNFNDIGSTVIVERVGGSNTNAGGTLERGNSFSPNYKGWYYLRTQLSGDALSLESNGATSKYMNGAAFMSSQKGATGTMWKFVPDTQHPGWYRLKSKDQGDNKCLESNGKESPVHGGASFMDDCKDVSGQLWVLELVTVKNGDHVYRLRSMLGDKKVSLEGNEPGGSKGGNAFMDNTQNVSGQMWRLVPVK